MVSDADFGELSDAQKLEQFIKQKELIEHYKKSKTTFDESGTFMRKIVRYGKKTTTKTDREYNKNNPEKVILGYLGTVEFFCYPHTTQDTVYVRIGKEVTGLDKYQINKNIAIYNILKWYVNGGGKLAIRGESNSKKANEIKEAYSAGFKKQLKEQKLMRDNEPKTSLQDRLRAKAEREVKEKDKKAEGE